MPNMLIVTASGWYGMMIDFSHSPSQISFNWMSITPLITHTHMHTHTSLHISAGKNILQK